MIGIFVCILPGFLLWGTASVIKSPKEKKAAYIRIFGKPVTPEDFNQAVQATRIQTMMQFGEAFEKFEKFLDFKGLAVERLILLHEAKSRGIKASDEAVRKAIAENPAFQRKGAFDPAGYEYMMRYALRIQPRLFEEITRQNLVLSGLYKQVTDKVLPEDKDIRAAYEKQNEQISVAYISALPAEFQKNIVLKDEELREYYSKNQQNFKEPMSFNLEYLTFETEPQAVGASQILAQKDGFDKTADELKLEIKETGLFKDKDAIPGIGWANEVLEALPKMQKGDTLPIHEVDKKYYAFRLKEIKEPFIPAFEAVIEKVKETAAQEKSKASAKEAINSCLTRLAGMAKDSTGPVDLDKAAQETGLKSSETDVFKFGSYIQGIGASDNFFTEAKKLKTNEFSPVIEMPGGFYIIRLKQLIPIDETKFTSEKSAFSEKYLSQKKEEKFGEFIKELKKKAGGAKN
ncbi:MAG: peptidylprolyl isomerase [Candidatus Omnitrophica bacterium]|nr:peptidylprolyl isomerase [Candidatus Omnitrophota bacterium]